MSRLPRLFQYTVSTPDRLMNKLESSGVMWATDKAELKRQVLNDWPFKGERVKSDELSWTTLEVPVAPELIKLIRVAQKVVRTRSPSVTEQHERALDELAALLPKP